ncbi:hypothetical protein BaOVIS_033180 [Babesia ovis]|uniref:RAP domain-containing protein n=1 Tax=Babesia ovis TaxID=5869 RepID=A0A9W5TFA4_BABOV|nr:hypothetical protein BaOVIS_033180 [Babesia ovis]
MLLSQKSTLGMPGTLGVDNHLLCGIGCSPRLSRVVPFRNCHQRRHTASAGGANVHFGGARMHDYLMRKNLSRLHPSDTAPSREQSYNRLRGTLSNLSSRITLVYDILDHSSPRTSPVEDVILSAPRYPKVSFFPDGHVNVSLSRYGLYNDFIRDAREYRSEDIALTKRLYPFRVGQVFLRNSINIKKFQRDLETHIVDFIGLSNASDLVTILRQLYLLNLPIRANSFGEISKKLLRGIGSLSTNELIEMCVLMTAYTDNNFKSVHLLLSAAASQLMKRSGAIASLPPSEILTLLYPIVQLQTSCPSTTWTILTDQILLQSVVSAPHLLDTSQAVQLFHLLTISNSISPLSADIATSRAGLVERLSNEMGSIDDRAMNRLLLLTDIVRSHFPEFSYALYSNALRRPGSIRPSVLASAYLSLDTKNEQKNRFLKKINRRFAEVTTKVLVDLYCRLLEDGSLTQYHLTSFEVAFSKRIPTLSMQDISNILIYHSSHGRQPTEINNMIKYRFIELKTMGNLKHDEILDVVLSMSLIGLHNQIDVWEGINVPHLVYSTPTNILVYLAYAFLITGWRNKGTWTILLERMLYEPKSYSHDMYEVLMVAKVLNIFPGDMKPHLLNRVSWILQHTKSQHYAKLSRQRFQPSAPIEEALDLIGLHYSNGVIIDELYEAPIYIASHKIILDPLRESYYHPMTGLEVGEVHLRHRVWHKQGYQSHTLNEYSLNKYKDPVSNEWNITELADFLCKIMKMEKYSPALGNNRLRLLRVNPNKSVLGKSLENHRSEGDAISSNIRRLRKMLMDRRDK